MTQSPSSRRDFMKQMGVAVAAAGVLPAGRLAMADTARPKFRVGAIGVGGRGRGAMHNLRAAAGIVGVDVEFVGVADAFQQKANQVGHEFGVPEAHRFGGFDSYRKLLEIPQDIVLMAAPPNFRPLHLEAAVAAGCHCFIEKPVAVDVTGCRRMYAIGEEATRQGFSIVAGTQRRHQASYLAQAAAVRDGAIGRITGGRLMWNQGALWVRDRQGNQSNAEYMANNWANFLEVSGDHIVEQHVHNIDIANWFIGHPPRLAQGFGGRARRRTGNQYDFFSVDLDYGDHCNLHSMCRQINGTYGRIGEWLTGTEGTVDGGGRIARFDGTDIVLPSIPVRHNDPYTQEHVALLESILEQKGLNETQAVTDATLGAVMGRIAAYTGQIVRWTDLTENTNSPWYNQTLTPTAEDFEGADDVELPEENTAPIPGRA